MRVAIYTRVSTGQQSPEMQRRELLAYCERRGWENAAEYSDVMSGGKDSRPALDRMLSDAKRRKFDVIVCWKLDRIGRSLKHLLNLLSELEAVGVALVSYSDSLDLSTPQGRLMFQIIGAMAEFERSLIRERVLCGLRNARARGVVLGRRRVPVDVARVNALRSAGLTWQAVSNELGIPRGTIFGAWSAASFAPTRRDELT